MATGNQKSCYRVSEKWIVLFIGAPGSGKGTQSSMLASHLGIPIVSTGAMLREEATRNTPAGFRLRQTMATGALVDDATVCGIVASRIEDLMALPGTASGGLILDGFPRTTQQAEFLNLLLERFGIAGPLVIHLHVPTEVLVRRLARRRQCAVCGAVYNLATEPSTGVMRCGVDAGALVERDDDSEGVVARRLATYEAETLPVLQYYRNREARRGIYRRIDGNRDAAAIAKGVCDILLLEDSALAA